MSEERFENENVEMNSGIVPGEAAPAGPDLIVSGQSSETGSGGSYYSSAAGTDTPAGPDLIVDPQPSGPRSDGSYYSSAAGTDTPAGPDLIGDPQPSVSPSDDSYYSSAAGAGTSAGPEKSGRYYNYERSTGTSAPARRTLVRVKKDRKLLKLALAVILVFILGAGAGAYASGRTAATSLSDSARSSSAQAQSDMKAQKNDAEDTDGSGEETVSQNDAAFPDRTQTESEGTPAVERGTITRVEDAAVIGDSAGTLVADMAERVMPSIVSVYNKYTQQGYFFGRSYTQESEAAGSGIIIAENDDELLIVTNNHVVEGADSLSVQFIDEENCEAALKGTDPGSDLAVISVPLSSIPAETRKKIAIAQLGDSDTLRIGEPAIAIGNALGYGQSLTVGYISALNREITSEDGITGTFIQTDAAINPGNSGGALLDTDGKVIGINSNKIGGSAVEGMGFAIPISKAIPIIEKLEQQESRTRVSEDEQGYLGIYGISVTSDVASAYGLPVGAYVEEIIPGSAAEKSDLQPGDIITGINGETVSGMESLQEQLAFFKAGEEVTLTIQHPMEGGQYEEREIVLTLSKRDEVMTEESGWNSNGNSNGNSNEESRGNRQQQEQFPSEDQGGDFFFGFPFGF